MSVPTMLTDLLTPLAEFGSEHPPILAEDGQRLSGEAFVDQVRQLATVMRAQFSIQPGDRVGLLFWNESSFLIGLFACRWVGAVAVPFNIMMGAQDLLYVFGHSQISLVLANGELLAQTAAQAGIPIEHIPFKVLVTGDNEGPLATLPQWNQLLAEAQPDPKAHQDPDSLAVLMYTSGTTGNPKGVMLSERNLLANMDAFAQMLDLETHRQQHRMLVGIPMFHAYGLMVALYGLAMQASLILVPKFQPKRLLGALIEEQVTILPLVPTMFHVLAQQVDKLPSATFDSLVCCISGGAALSPELLRKVETFLGAPVLEGYGLTETSPVIAVNTPERGSVPGSVGPTLINLDVRLMPESGEPLSVGAGQESGIGEIQVKGPSVMLGYYQADELTAQAMTTDGYFRTGDLGSFDERGNLRIVGRIKELIIKAGENISPIPIEQVIARMPHLSDVAVVGQPDARLGERIVAFVSLNEDQQMPEAEVLTAIKQIVREHLPPLQQPDDIRIVESLPKTPTGKVIKKQLRQQLLDEATVAV